MATPHIEAKKEEVAKIVIMPGDPLRAKFIAKHYLTEVKQFNQVRNMLGFTGFYKGKRISVIGSGMGIPSMAIYSYELFKFYDVQKIIRIGSCGAITKDITLATKILVEASYSDSSYSYVQNGRRENFISSSLSLTNIIADKALEKGLKLIRGNIYTTDVFYKDSKEDFKLLSNYKCLASEMETFALFHNAHLFNREAACLLTVINYLDTKEEIDPIEREQYLIESIELVLEALL